MSLEWLETAWNYTKVHAGEAWDAISNCASFLYDEASYGCGYVYHNFLYPLLDMLSSPDFYSWTYDHFLYFVGWLIVLNSTYHPLIVTLRNALMFVLTLRYFSRESSMPAKISMAIMMVMYVVIAVLVVYAGINPVIMTKIAGALGLVNIIKVGVSIYNRKTALNNFRPGGLNDRGEEITLEQVQLDYFTSKRSMVFAVMNLIGIGIMLAGYIHFDTQQVFLSTMGIFANSIFEFVDRSLCNYSLTKSIGRRIERVCCCCFGVDSRQEEPGPREQRRPSQSYLAINGHGVPLPHSPAEGVDHADELKASASGRRADAGQRLQPRPGAVADASARQDVTRSPNGARV